MAETAVAASRMVCISSERASVGAASARMVRPTGPFVSLVSIGRIAIVPSSTSAATTPAEMIQIASLARTKARPKASDTVSIWFGRLAMPLVIKKRSTKGRMIEARVGISTGKSASRPKVEWVPDSNGCPPRTAKTTCSE